MDKIVIENSKVIEFVSEIANRLVIERFGENAIIWDDDNSSGYTEDAQDFFNETYDSVETDLSHILGIVI